MLSTHRLLEPRTAFLITLLVSLGALAAAFIAQFVYHLKPCILCLWQRLPYALLALDALGFLLLEKKFKPYLGFALFGMALVALAGAGLAFAHIGVEQKWWVIGAGCPVEPLGEKTSAEALAALLATPQAPCDETSWWILGIPVTLWNTLLSLALAAYLFTVSMRAPKS